MTAKTLPSEQELAILREVLNQARLTLLVSIKRPAELGASLARLNMACLAHWNWQTERIKELHPDE
jgi:hypothetical protein